MLRSIEAMRQYALRARDGSIGRVVDTLFEDSEWRVRHLVVDTGRWLPGKRVLIDPDALEASPEQGQELPTRLTREEVKASPQIDADPPVSKEKRDRSVERSLWPPFWPAMGLGGAGAVAQTSPAAVPVGLPPTQGPDEITDDTQEPHLRSADEIQGYDALGRDGKAGSISDVLVDVSTWTVPHVVIDLHRSVPGSPVMVPTSRVQDINSKEKKISIDASLEEIAAFPACEPAALGARF